MKKVILFLVITTLFTTAGCANSTGRTNLAGSKYVPSANSYNSLLDIQPLAPSVQEDIMYGLACMEFWKEHEEWTNSFISDLNKVREDYDAAVIMFDEACNSVVSFLDEYRKLNVPESGHFELSSYVGEEVLKMQLRTYAMFARNPAPMSKELYDHYMYEVSSLEKARVSHRAAFITEYDEYVKPYLDGTIKH